MKQSIHCPHCQRPLEIEVCIPDGNAQQERQHAANKADITSSAPDEIPGREHSVIVKRPALIAFIWEWCLAIAGLALWFYPVGTISLFLSSEGLGALMTYPLLITGLRFAGFLITTYYVGKIILTVLSSRYTFGPGGVQASNGIIKRTNSSIQYQHIQSVDIRQGYIERMLDIGNIYMATAGTSEAEVAILRVSNPLSIQQLVEARIG